MADRLAETAAKLPNTTALFSAAPTRHRFARSRRGPSGATYASITFAELDAEANSIARGLITWGVPRGSRIALLVRPGIEFVALVFGLLRAGMAIILIDPGLGKRNVLRCLEEACPDGFIAIPIAQLIRRCAARRFPRAVWQVTVGRRWFWGGRTLAELQAMGERGPATSLDCAETRADDPAAIIFTSGSTGPPKGVLYTHRMFDAQVSEIQSTYGIRPGAVDLACFPLFALFNSAMGVTTILPSMDFSRPASADPSKLVAAANDWQATQAFASPAVWRRIGNYSARTGARIPSLQQVFSCGAPVTTDVLRATLACVAPDASMHTPYGATECLPVATIEAQEVLDETDAETVRGAGVCVGRRFRSIEWRIIPISDAPIRSLGDCEELPIGQIGELVVRGPQASPQYVTRSEANKDAKIPESSSGMSLSSSPAVWHRMGDVGYFDDRGRFWYCGRKSQRVETPGGTLYTECVEAIINTHPQVARSALVGVGERPRQSPVIVVERRWRHEPSASELLGWANSQRLPQPLEAVLFHPNLPVDVRHNAKINREQLAVWASRQLARSERPTPH